MLSPSEPALIIAADGALHLAATLSPPCPWHVRADSLLSQHVHASPRLLILDVDGTLVRTRSGKPHRTASNGLSVAADWEWLPGVRELIAAMRAADPSMRIAIATNQGGVAGGFVGKDDITAEIQKVADGLGDDVFVTIAYGMKGAKLPEYKFDDPTRKPAPGALLAAMQHFGVAAADTRMVGDRPEDRAAAAAAGCHFSWAWDFFPTVDPPQQRGVA